MIIVSSSKKKKNKWLTLYYLCRVFIFRHHSTQRDIWNRTPEIFWKMFCYFCCFVINGVCLWPSIRFVLRVVKNDMGLGQDTKMKIEMNRWSYINECLAVFGHTFFFCVWRWDISNVNRKLLLNVILLIFFGVCVM